MGRKCLPVVTDVSRKSDVVVMADKTMKEFSKIDVLVCNAGIGGASVPVVDMEEKDWDECIAINLKGTFLCCQAALKYMIPRRRGRIITISAIRAPLWIHQSKSLCVCKTCDLGTFESLGRRGWTV